jgi:hypothetical protein
MPPAQYRVQAIARMWTARLLSVIQTDLASSEAVKIQPFWRRGAAVQVEAELVIGPVR